jgi:hypothetical protein
LLYFLKRFILSWLQVVMRLFAMLWGRQRMAIGQNQAGHE